MSDRVSALLSIIGSPVRKLGIVLMLIFTVEVGVMFVLPHKIPNFLGEFGKAVFDAVPLTLVCAPVLWWVIFGPLRRIAIQEHGRSETIESSVSKSSEAIVSLNREASCKAC